ncbi:MAG: hypothetical protein PF482_15260 [Desulfobacteraceae bacterium]|jgi:hypothetical protein|nr:hypothetical protein [Desulfobacteraceae bacterium]
MKDFNFDDGDTPTKLEKMQAQYRNGLKKLKEIKNMETRTADQETEFDNLVDSMEQLGKEIDVAH